MTKHKENKTNTDIVSKKMEIGGILPYSEKELELTPDLQDKIEKLMNFFDESGISYDKFDSTSIPKLDLDNKKAYPNNDSYFPTLGQHDINKWLQALRTINYLESNGENRVKAIRKVVSGWHVLETFDFLNWVKFYGSNDHLKYKFAQLWYENGQPGYFLHIKPDPKPESETKKDIDFAVAPSVNNIADEERKNIIERQRTKIIGRLDSAEKLLRSQEGHFFAGKEFEALLEGIYDLKKRIHMVNKASPSTRLYDDMIVRQANILVRNGFVKAADVLFSLAQANNPPPANIGSKNNKAITPATPMPPTNVQGAPGGLPATIPSNHEIQSDNVNDTSPISKFLSNLDGNNSSYEDNQNLEVEDVIDVSDVDDELLVTEAQTAPIQQNITNKPVVNVNSESSTQKMTEQIASDFDNKVNQVFSNITVTDVVVKLEDLAKVFKVREIPRQLGIIDMMLDSLGLASYFPSLSEATNKALESNNYISTRVEDILSKLRGSMHTRKIDLKGTDQEDNPAVSDIKNKLQSDEDKEKARKKMRKEQENAELESSKKETPEVEIEEDLSAPPLAAPPPIAPVSKTNIQTQNNTVK